jgi:ribosomal protein L24E
MFYQICKNKGKTFLEKKLKPVDVHWRRKLKKKLGVVR